MYNRHIIINLGFSGRTSEVDNGVLCPDESTATIAEFGLLDILYHIVGPGTPYSYSWIIISEYH